MRLYGRAIAAAIVLLPSTGPAAVAAQAGPSGAPVVPGAIVVQVTDTSLNPLGAELVITEIGLAVRLPAEGVATLVEVPDGAYRLEVRHEGYTSESRLLRIAGDTLRVQFMLSPAAGEPADNAAPIGRDIAKARLRYFIERSATLTPGTFLTRSTIQRRGVRTLSAVLRDLEAVRVERVGRGRTIVRSLDASGPSCADGMRVFVDGAGIVPSDVSRPNAAAELSGRGARHPAQWQPAANEGDEAAPALQWVGPNGGDFVRVANGPGSASRATAPRAGRVTDIDRVRLSSVAAVEVYSSPGSTPPEFQMPGTECGVVLIWTTGV